MSLAWPRRPSRAPPRTAIVQHVPELDDRSPPSRPPASPTPRVRRHWSRWYSTYRPNSRLKLDRQPEAVGHAGRRIPDRAWRLRPAADGMRVQRGLRYAVGGCSDGRRARAWPIRAVDDPCCRPRGDRRDRCNTGAGRADPVPAHVQAPTHSCHPLCMDDDEPGELLSARPQPQRLALAGDLHPAPMHLVLRG